MKNSYEEAQKRYKDLENSTYDTTSEAFHLLNTKQKIEEIGKNSNLKLGEIFVSTPSTTTFGSLPEIDWDEIEEGAGSKEHLTKKLKDLYLYKKVFMGRKQNIYNLNKNEFLEQYNIGLGSHVKKLQNIIRKVLEKGIITLQNGADKKIKIQELIGIETLGENSNNGDTVIGFNKEVKSREKDKNDFNHHPVFVFKDQNGNEEKITYHALLEMKVD